MEEIIPRTKMFIEQLLSSIVLPPIPLPYFDRTYFLSDNPPAAEEEVEEEEVAGVVEVQNNNLPYDYSRNTPQYPNISFEPDNFQKQCFYYINKSQSIFVTAHTSSGKTLIAEYASYVAGIHETRMIYTSPIKALSNQKYREFAQKFPSVGILTGDAQINSTARTLVMTTEILRNMLYRRSTILDDVEFVVFDEIHYLGDKERGVVWEEVIIMLPRHVSLIFLSATSPNARDMCKWISTIKNKEMYLIGTEKRAVELEHGVYFRGSLYITTENGKFSHSEYERAKSTGAVEVFKDKQRNNPNNTNLQRKPVVEAKKKGPTVLDTPVPIARDLVDRKLSPVVFFDFSKARIEQSFSMCDSLDMTSTEEKGLIKGFIYESISKLPKVDRDLPQIGFVIPGLIRGVGMHHSGLLPILKEIVEMLFTTGAIRVLFTTETLAMGLNMPARTVVIRNTKKYNPENRGYVNISVGEYTQMAGRAGRRGYDTKGTAIIECTGQEILEEDFLVKLQTGSAMEIESKFYITARMILKLLRIKGVSIEEMVRLSFGKSKEEQEIRKIVGEQRQLRMELVHSIISCVECSDALSYIEKYVKIVRQLGSVYGAYVPEKREEYRIIRGSVWEIVKRPHNQMEMKEEGTGHILIIIGTDGLPVALPQKDFKLVKEQTEGINGWKELDKYKCILNCRYFQEHYKIYLREYIIRENIRKIDRKLSSTNTSGLECNNYFNYIMFLRELEYIDSMDNLKLKGKIAYEFNSIECVLTTEILLSPLISEIKTSHLIIGLVGLTFYEKHQLKEEADHPKEEIRVEEIRKVKPALEIIDGIVFGLRSTYRKYKIKMDLPNHAFCGELSLWLENKSLSEIIEASPLSEGVIIKYIKKATEICTEISIAAKILGNTKLSEKVELINEKLKRGIVFTPSLYYG